MRSTTEWPFQNYSLFIRCTRYLYHGIFYAQRFLQTTLTDSNFFVFYRFDIIVIEETKNTSSEISCDHGKLCLHVCSSNVRNKFIHFSFFPYAKDRQRFKHWWFPNFLHQEAQESKMFGAGVTFCTKQSALFIHPKVYG